MNTKVVGRRVGASLIDSLVVIALQGLLFALLAENRQDAINAGGGAEVTTYANVTLGDTEYAVTGSKAALYFALVLAINVGYFVILQGLRGFTLGKLALGLRVVKDDGTSPPGVGRAFGRWFLYIADGFPYIIPYLTGFIVAMVHKDHKRIGDMVASTLVVSKDSVGASPSASGLDNESTPTWVEGTRGSGL